MFEVCLKSFCVKNKSNLLCKVLVQDCSKRSEKFTFTCTNTYFFINRERLMKLLKYEYLTPMTQLCEGN